MKSIVFILLIGLFACTPADTSSEPSKELPTETKYLEIPNNSIINLYDAFGEENPELSKDFGFSCILNYEGKIILFDAGTNADIFKNNVESLKIDLKDIDFVVISHSHFDHINGLDYLLEINPDVKIFFPFDAFWGANIPFNIQGQDSTIIDSIENRMKYFDGEIKNYVFNQSGRFWKANVEYIRENMEIIPGVKLITTTSSFAGYFYKYPNLGINSDDLNLNNTENQTTFIGLPELSLALQTEKGEVIIVGCSHSTVEKIVEETKSFTHSEVNLVYGGFHLLPYDRPTLKNLADRLIDDLKVSKVAPAHCTGPLAFNILQKRYGENYIFAGLGKTIEF